MTRSHQRKERMRKQRNQSIRWFVQDTAALLIVAAGVYTIGIVLIGIGELLL
jgi:succinate dehydrogenase hydrophobic anchor subunit